ncbi:MAG: 50S ribosomal protein L2 [Thermodesulfobacteriota bacterium]
MAIKRYKPTSPGVRQMTTLVPDGLTKKRPERSLTSSKKRSGGRNSNGRITVRYRTGGHKRLYREIDFKRQKYDIPANVLSIEYDPNRTSNIALICYADGEKNYILAPHTLTVGDQVVSGEKVDIKPGNALPIKNIPLGTFIHNIEMKPLKGGQIARSAGGYAQLMAKEGTYANIKLPSSEVRLIHQECYASIGQLSNLEHENVVIGKAGRKRWMGRGPHVRGTAMNPVDHPHGGGEGRSKGGNQPSSPWGTPAKGYKTRKKSKTSSKYIVSRRKK